MKIKLDLILISVFLLLLTEIFNCFNVDENMTPDSRRPSQMIMRGLHRINDRYFKSKITPIEDSSFREDKPMDINLLRMS